MPLGKSCGIPKRLHNIFFYPHTANTGLAPHNGRVLGYPVKIFIEHKTKVTQKQAKSKFNGYSIKWIKKALIP
jgi:hypothetical protein